MGKNRLRYIDIAKGIAIICIILGHLGDENINRVVFTFHVPIFFFITGYFTNSERNITEFAKNKLRTLIVPYIVTCLLIVILGTMDGWNKGNPLYALEYWSKASLYGAGTEHMELFFIPPIGALWFLWATFWGDLFLRVSLNFDKYLRVVFIASLFLFGYYSRRIFWFPLSIQAGACAALFMYIGWLLRGMKETIKNIPQEIKCFGIFFMAATWIAFIKNFQSFWLVNGDMGRGIVDIIGCMCACIIVICICKLIDVKLKLLSDFFAYFGRFSLLVLCVHIIELNLFDWWRFAGKFVQYGMPESWKLMFIIFVKITADLSIVYILSKISFVRKIYGIRA